MPRAKQASARECFVCGVENPVGLQIKFYQTAPGEVSAEFTPPEHFQGYPGNLHGGITATVLDETAGRALMGISPPRFMVTAKLEIKYRQRIPVGQPLKLIGKAGKEHGRFAESWAGIFNDREELLAEANALLADMPNPPASSDLEPAGWKIYPDE